MRQLRALLEPDPEVVALAVFGSMRVGAVHDVWSDLDLLLVVQEAARPRFFPALDWLALLGTVFAHEQFSGDDTWVTRLCYDDFRRLDLVITTPERLAHVDTWARIGFWKGLDVCFARASEVATMLARTFPAPALRLSSDADFARMAADFWWKGVVAVEKVVRGDLLIALHLALDLVRAVCVLAMVLRDRAVGTTIHREGGVGNDFVAALDFPGPPYDAARILDLVADSAARFDALAVEWSASYVPQRAPLVDAIARARRDLGL